jgi:predicted kinase
MARLVSLAGLPGTGKSAIARELARATGALWLRIDSIEQAIRNAGVSDEDLAGAGYHVGYGVAEDNLRLGHDVVADSVNPWMLTRDAWRDAGLRAGAAVVEVEVICSDRAEHRRRVESRPAEVTGLTPPDWAAVTGRDYRAWTREPLVIDTARLALADAVSRVLEEFRAA